MASVNGVIATVEYYSEDKDYENWEVDQQLLTTLKSLKKDSCKLSTFNLQILVEFFYIWKCQN